MKNIFLISLLFTFSALSFAQDNIYLQKTDCFLDDCETFSNQPNVEFGFLHVPEDYDDPDGRYIKIAYQIVKSTVANPEPDPILVFAGGWGMPALGSTSYIDGMPVKNRDIILYDYRGTGYSTPALCDDLGQKQWEITQQDLDYEAFHEQLSQAFYSCLDSLEQADIDYRHYGTASKTIDAVKLIEQLGYEEVNLFGISNGTMGIQGFIRAAKHSPIKIRSIFSDSNVPMKDFMRGDGTLLYKQVLDKILNDCSSVPQCARAYPDLKERFYAFLKESLKKPLVHEGETEITLNTYEINIIIHQLVYSSDLYKDIPLLLEAFINGDTKFIDVMMPGNTLSKFSGASLINYTYDWKAREAQVTREYEQTKEEYPEFLWADFWLDFYTNDTTITYNPEDTIPVTSDVPALVLAGTYDPITPPAFSRIMHNRYRNSYYFEFPKVGHGAFRIPCGKELLRNFLEEPSVKPNGDCVEQLAAKPIPFTTSLYANASIIQLVQQVTRQRNVWWIITLALPLLLSLVYLITQAVRAIRKKRVDSLKLGLFALILVFLLGLVYHTYQTIQLGGLTLIFGLHGSASWLPWGSTFIMIIGLITLFRMIRKSEYSFWTIGALVATILVLVTSFAFDIHIF